MKLKQRIVLGITSGLVTVLLAMGIYVWRSVYVYKKQVSETTVNPVALSEIEDGVYHGLCDLKFVIAEVDVFIQNHRIEKIDLVRHENGRGERAEVLIDRVVEAQSLNLDTITGATASSKAILKSIENALHNQAAS